jgi:hypothetical protein
MHLLVLVYPLGMSWCHVRVAIWYGNTVLQAAYRYIGEKEKNYVARNTCCSVADPDLTYFGKLNLDPDPHQSENQDPHQSK